METVTLTAVRARSEPAGSYNMSADVFDSALDLEETHIAEGRQQGIE